MDTKTDELAGRVALVTGGSRGIGSAIVRGLADAGASVAFTYLSSEEEAAALEDYASPSSIVALQADARSYDRATEVCEEVTRKLGPIDILVNNAAAATHRRFDQMTEADWDSSIEGTLKVVFNYTHAVIPSMKTRGSGNIIHISSINGLRGREGSSAYCAAKAAINGLTKVLAREFGPDGIRVNAIAPGFVATKSQESTSELVKKLVQSEMALTKFTVPEEIAQAVVFLASDRVSTLTGHVLQVDAGQWI